MAKNTHSFKDVLDNPKHPLYFITSDFLALVTIISIISIVLESMPQLSTYRAWFVAIEWVSVAIFTIEYVFRIAASQKKLRYIFSPFGLIDLISILPTYLGLTNLTFLKSARILRIMRLLRMLRIARIRNLKQHHDHDKQLSFYALNVGIFLTVLVSATLLMGILIYVVEGHRVAFESIPNGMWWSFRIFTNDPTFIQTETIGGEVVYILARVVGLIVFGTLVGVITNVFKRMLFSEK